MTNKQEQNRNIADYARITGLPASKIRYYEKQGLQGVSRQENGYRSFCRQSIYMLNDMKSLCARGFSIKESLRLAEEGHSADELLSLLCKKEAELEHQLLITQAMKQWAEETRMILEQLRQHGSLLYLTDLEDQMFLPACVGEDYSIGIQNGDVRRQWNDYFPVNRLVGILDTDRLSQEQPINYGDIVSVSDFTRFHFPADHTVQKLTPGRCLCFNFQEERDGFFSLSAYPHVLQYMEAHHLQPVGHAVLQYLFLNFTERYHNDGIAMIPVRKKENR